LAERLRAPPADGGRWTGAEVALWMAAQLGVERVHPQRGRQALKRVRWSVQAPRPRHPRSATPEQRAEFEGGSTRQLPRPRRRIPAARSRPGPRTSTASGRSRSAAASGRRSAAGERPTALGHHRHQWPHVTAFVQPTSGEAVWFLSNGPSKPLFEKLLAAFARGVGAGRERYVALVLDNAGWRRPRGLAVPDGITLVFLPPYSPELQPAERLWPLVDEPVADTHFATLADLDAAIAGRCRCLDAHVMRPHTSFHRWPKPVQPN
jgi:hypothetical protein